MHCVDCLGRWQSIFVCLCACVDFRCERASGVARRGRAGCVAGTPGSGQGWQVVCLYLSFVVHICGGARARSL